MILTRDYIEYDASAVEKLFGFGISINFSHLVGVQESRCHRLRLLEVGWTEIGKLERACDHSPSPASFYQTTEQLEKKLKHTSAFEVWLCLVT